PERCERERRDARRECHADERERQREHGVRELHEAHPPRHRRLAGERLPFPHSPNLGQSASTRAFVAASISITVGQFRVKPSSGNFFVASRPIFEPYVNARLEWSSTSI